MEESKEIIDVVDSEVVSVSNKSNWVGKIMLKQVQGLPLSDEEWSFYMNMFVNAKDSEIEKLAKGSIVELQKIAADSKNEIDAETFWSLKQRDAHLIQNLLKTLKQGRRDDSATRRNNLSTFNRAVKEARKRGGFYAGEGKEFVKTADDVIDLTKEDNK